MTEKNTKTVYYFTLIPIANISEKFVITEPPFLPDVSSQQYLDYLSDTSVYLSPLYFRYLYAHIQPNWHHQIPLIYLPTQLSAHIKSSY